MKDQIASLLIATGAPQEIALEVKFEMTFAGPLRERIEAQCAVRRCDPSALIADIIEKVIVDDLFAAVID